MDYKVYEYKLAQLDTAILGIKETGEKLKIKIQNVGLSVIRLWGKKEIEPQRAAELFNALASASPYHAKAVNNWIKMFTPLEWSDETKGWFAHVEARVNGDTFKEMRNNPFWQVSPPADPKPFDALAMLEALLAKNAKKLAKHGEEDKVLSNAQMNAIRKALHSVEQEGE